MSFSRVPPSVQNSKRICVKTTNSFPQRPRPRDFRHLAARPESCPCQRSKRDSSRRRGLPRSGCLTRGSDLVGSSAALVRNDNERQRRQTNQCRSLEQRQNTQPSKSTKGGAPTALVGIIHLLRPQANSSPPKAKLKGKTLRRRSPRYKSIRADTDSTAVAQKAKRAITGRAR